jgi:hypothetical protein
MSSTDTINPKQLIRELREEMLDTDDGVSVHTLKLEFRRRYDHLKTDLADQWWDKFISNLAAAEIKPARHQQQMLPGFGDVPHTVTTFDGEGGHVHKRLTRATRQDLLNDETIQQQNAEAAERAYRQARDRNAYLIAVMDEHDFNTAAEAIAYLTTTDEDDAHP